jgi:hypothetical protein
MAIRRRLRCNCAARNIICARSRPPCPQGFGFITPAGDDSEEAKEDLFVHQVDARACGGRSGGLQGGRSPTPSGGPSAGAADRVKVPGAAARRPPLLAQILSLVTS